MVSSKELLSEIGEAKSVLKKVKKLKDPQRRVEGIIRQEKRIKELTKEEKRTKQKERVSKRIGGIAEKISTGDIKAFKKKILRKPTAKGPRPISAKKTLRSFADSTGPVVREVEPQEVVQDDRSLFFKQEFAREQAGVNKWLS